MLSYRLRIAICLVSFLCAGTAHAQTLVYSDLASFTGQAFANGGAATIGTNTISTLVADDLTYGGSFAGHVPTSISFTVANFNTVNVSARPRLRFYNSNGTSGGPGTVLAGFSFNPITFTAGQVSTFSFNPNGAFVLPGSGTIWAGITFDNNNGATGATLAQLNNLGQGIYNPPTVGTSQDVFFKTTAAGDFLVNNPTGGFVFFGGNPVANFGWAITATSAPEPGTAALVLSGALLGVRARRRQKPHKN